MGILDKIFNLKKEELKSEIKEELINEISKNCYSHESYNGKNKESEKVIRPRNIEEAISSVEDMPYNFDSLFDKLNRYKLNKIEIISFYGDEDSDEYDSLPVLSNKVFVYYYNENNERIKYIECPISSSADGCIYSEYACKRREISYNLCKYIANRIKDTLERELIMNKFNVEIIMLEDKLDNLLHYNA